MAIHLIYQGDQLPGAVSGFPDDGSEWTVFTVLAGPISLMAPWAGADELASIVDDSDWAGPPFNVRPPAKWFLQYPEDEKLGAAAPVQQESDWWPMVPVKFKLALHESWSDDGGWDGSGLFTPVTAGSKSIRARNIRRTRGP